MKNIVIQCQNFLNLFLPVSIFITIFNATSTEMVTTRPKFAPNPPLNGIYLQL